MRYGSVCSGIEAATVAWHPLGWTPVFYSEIEAFPSAVLSHRFPSVPNHGDMTAFRNWPNATLDVFVGGTPCQSFSVAGLRAGLADPRGNLALTYLAIAELYRPRWLLWENVPGVLSSEGGRDFATFLSALGELGYGWAYRVLDAQYFGVPQRRRRVFVVGSSRGWASAAAVLFELACLRGDPPPSRPSRQRGSRPSSASARESSHELTAHTLRAGGFDASEDGTGRGTPLVTDAPELSGAVCARDAKGPNSGIDQGAPLLVVPFDSTQITHPENRSNPQPGDPAPTLAAAAHAPSIAFSCKDYGQDAAEISPTLRAMNGVDSHANGGGQVAIAFNVYPSSGQGADLELANTEVAMACTATDAKRHERGTRLIQPEQIFESRFARNGRGKPSSVCPTLKAEAGQSGKGDSAPMTFQRSGIRRITPRECERLQGLPDDFTLITFAGKPSSDGARYRAIGNSMAVPVMRWLGQRISLVESLLINSDRRCV